MLNTRTKTPFRLDGLRTTALRLVLFMIPCLTVPIGLAQAQGQSGITVTASGPGGTASQTLPGQGGRFDLTVPLTRNAVNTLTVTATDASGQKASAELKVTQLSLDQIVVSQVTAERLAPQQVKQLVADGVISVDNPANFNVSKFDIVLTIANKPVPISVAVPTPVAVPETGWETYQMPQDSGNSSGGAPQPPPTEIVVFEEPIPATPGRPAISVPGVIVIEGNIKSLKEFYTVRLLLMNTSGIFTLKDVVSNISFPDGGLASVAPADGIVSFGDILPGDGGHPGQAERQFIIRGDAIGVRHVKVGFGGTVAGPGIPDDSPVPFNGAAVTQVEVKGPPTFKVRATHPAAVQKDVPYEFGVEITNTGDVPALYASLALSVGAAGTLASCDGATPVPNCEPIPNGDTETRTLGDILPGKSVSTLFHIIPSKSGTISSCLGVSDQNITLEVLVGTIGCLVGQTPPDVGVPDGTPTVTVVPTPNTQGVAIDGAVTAFFSQSMDPGTITTGASGTMNVYDRSGALVPGVIHVSELNGKSIAIWQVNDGVTNRLAPNVEYTVTLTQAITNASGVALYNAWSSRFTTSGTASDDITPPTLTLSVEPPVNPSYVLPGQLVKVDAYAADQGSGVVRVELRAKDLTALDTDYRLIDRKVVFSGDRPPFIFAIDSAQLVRGHSYQLMATAYDYMMNGQTATIGLIIASSAAPPTVTLPAPPSDGIPQGISVSLVPDQVTGGVTEVRYFLDAATTPFATVNLPPYQASTGTVSLPLGSHTVRVVAVDGLDQTGTATYEFNLVANPNKPQVALTGMVSGATYSVGSSFVVSGTASDPIGIASVTCRLDGTPTAAGNEPFTVSTGSLALGVHTISVDALNVLGVGNTLTATFNVAEPPNGPPPAAPTIASLTTPSGGVVTIGGRTASGARVDVVNATRHLAITVYADGSGSFSATVGAAVGDVISVVAYDYGVSQRPSDAATATVPAAPALASISATPTAVTLTAVNAWRDLNVTAHYDSGTDVDVTAQATYSSSNPAVATVSATGRVVALKSGTTAVTTSFGGFTSTVGIAVDIVTLTSIAVDPAAISFAAIGESRQLAVTAHYSNGTTQVVSAGLTFTSADNGVATVTSAGLVTAVANGSTTVTVYLPGTAPVPLPVGVNTANDTPPHVAVLSPVPGDSFQRGELVTVSIHATDAVGGVKRVTMTAVGAGNTVVGTETREVTPASADITLALTFTVSNTLPLGSQITITAGAEDTSGQTATTQVTGVTVVDNLAPAVTITAPTSQARYRYGDTVTVRVAATDAVGVSAIRFATTGGVVFSGSHDIVPASTSAATEFQFTLPYGFANPDVHILAYATDTSGHEGAAVPVAVIVTSADNVPPATEVTSVVDPAGQASTTVAYRVTSGVDDLHHVELYFRRNGIGTFNRYTSATGGNPAGQFVPQSGDTGTIPFDSTRMGGDGTYEFYTVGVDQAGNRESAPSQADATMAFGAGTLWTVITTPATTGEGDTTYDGLNIRVNGTTFTVNGGHTFKNVELLNGAVLTHAPATTSTETHLDVTLWSLSIDATSRVDAAARGYLGGSRSGNDCNGRTLGNVAGSTYRAAGSFGGVGGAFDGTPNPVYGSITDPAALGSGGSCGPNSRVGGNGGGWIAIHAINVVVDGTVTVNGEAGSPDYSPGAGSGGTVNVATSTLSGRGLLTANGGGNEIGGGGGRIAVGYLDISTMDTSRIRALGGQGSSRRGANGTVFLRSVEGGNGTLVIDGQGASSEFTTLQVPGGYVFDDIQLRNGAQVVADTPILVAGTLSVLGGSTLTHSLESEAGLRIRAARVVVDETSAIDVSARGYRGGGRDGNGACEGRTLGGVSGATYRAGGSYGGFGGVVEGSSNPPYGQPDQAIYLGSGGSCGPNSRVGGNGGGLVAIEASELVEVNGRIAANGQDGSRDCQPGGGSGGSVNIKTSLLRGTGTITANGGGVEVGGGGGRVVVRYDYLGQSGEDLDNLRNITALGGHDGSLWGSAGTVLMKRSDQAHGDLYVDEGQSGSTSPVWAPLTTLGFGKVKAVTESSFTTDGGVRLAVNGLVGMEVNPNLGQSVTYTVLSNTDRVVTVDTTGKPTLTSPGAVAVGNIYAGVYRFDNVYFRRGGFLVVGDRLMVDGLMRIDDHGQLTHFDASLAFEPHLDLTVGTLQIGTTGSINLDGRGYLGGIRGGNDCSGRTVGNIPGSVYRSAGSYGGKGAVFDGGPANVVYGSVSDPAALGSGGSCGPNSRVGGDGGGWLALHAGQVIVDGAVSANGIPGSSDYAPGAGSGGTINITAASLTGGGSIRANGGGNEVGGGGGRIAVRYETRSFELEQFSVLGGHGTTLAGGNGTLFLKQQDQPHGDIVIDGANQATPSDSTPIPPGYVFDNLTLRNGAQVVADTPLAVSGTLALAAGSTLTHSIESEAGLDITAARVDVDSTSAIDVTGRGYRGGGRDGNGACEGRTLGGLTGSTYRSAGSYGGFGGVVEGAANPPYGQPSFPVYLGSGGSCGPNSRVGGNGGGRVSIQASESLVVNGRILANGGNASADYAPGGGSGGSVNIATPLLRGTGTIAANGAGPEVGGGGGRVAVRYDTLGASGDDLGGLRSITAFGAHGTNSWGSAGTVLMKRGDQAYGDLYIDDNMSDTNTSSAWTPLTPLGFGKVVALKSDTLTTTGAVRLAVNGLVGLEVNPNIAQSQTFTVLSNTATTITVDLRGKSAGGLLDVAAVGDSCAGVYRFDNVYFRRGGFLVTGDTVIVNGTMRIDEHGKLTHFDTTLTFEPRLDLTVGTLEVKATGSIDVDGRGYLGGGRGGNDCTGQTRGNAEGATYRAAGSYGGRGGALEGTTNPVYGDADAPAGLGSGGSCGPNSRVGGNGGGWIAIRANRVNLLGTITANGGNGSRDYAPGSGSGGTVNIVTTNLFGAGTISANGGGNEVGGGGGRIGIRGVESSSVSATVQANGGYGTAASGANGTVVIRQ